MLLWFIVSPVFLGSFVVIIIITVGGFYRSPSAEVLHLTKKRRKENAYEKGKPAVISKSDTAQSDDGFGANKFHRPAHIEAVDADLDYINVAAALRNDVNPDQICTELDASHIYQSLTADSVQKDSIYHSALVTVNGHRGEHFDIRCPYESGYESYSKYLCKGECNIGNKNIMVESGSPAKDKRFTLTDNTTARVFTVTITDLRTEDAGQYWCAVKRTLPLHDIYSEIILQVKLGNKTTEFSTISSFSNTPSYFSTTKVNQQSTSTTITERKETITDKHKSTSSFVITITAEALFLLLIGPLLVIVAFRKKKKTKGLLSSSIIAFNPVLYEQIKDTEHHCNTVQL
ncbi:CMRF35-like molecule 1 [Labeo rohita]|uniref:CMRF35-like molecule 1 n=1 Tax=Labeo rohita TaxID=84645 RepID=A0A498NBY7_LABRO|nr:CMRF35-like molecule 1 [Labeo rohita]